MHFVAWSTAELIALLPDSLAHVGRGKDRTDRKQRMQPHYVAFTPSEILCSPASNLCLMPVTNYRHICTQEMLTDKLDTSPAHILIRNTRNSF